ncbi:zinc finger protein 239-like [Mugil cephalus]|uniref:zinc finger protein 239-like n=1 Tax=Mugil cephalus TaxID=48193 RepID=UPI001FB65E6F|nr:zinc finger protein 239-like [Mugil cephalus]
MSSVIVTMSSSESLRELIIERLTAAAEEIFGLFERTVVQYEEEIDRQRRLLDITWKPEIKLHRIDQPQHYVCKEEEVVDDQLSKQERASSLNQEEPEPLQLKEGQAEPEPPQINQEQEEPEPPQINQEQEEPEPPGIKQEQEEPEPPGIKQEQEEFSCSSQQEEHLVLKLEADSLMETSTDEESELSEPQPKSESPDQGGIEYVDSGSTRNAELNPKKRRRRCRDTSHSNVDNSPMSESQSDTDTDKKSVTCDICGKTFKTNFKMRVHRRFHTGERPYCCETCGKSFRRSDNLSAHKRIHTVEHLYSCDICGKDFSWRSHLNAHMRTHTGERPYCCKTCGKSFSSAENLSAHKRIHAGEHLYICDTCGRGFRWKCHLNVHMRIHTGEKPHLCKGGLEYIGQRWGPMDRVQFF